jgi:hypothetical protein
VKRTIAKENTSFGTKSKLSFIVRTKIRPTGTSKSSKGIIVWCDMKKAFSGGFKIEHFAREQIYEKCGSNKSSSQIFEAWMHLQA